MSVEIQFWDREVEKFVAGLEKATIAKVLRTFDLLEKFGHKLEMPHSKKIESGLFELRIRGDQEVRFLYVFNNKKVVIVLHGFIKKSQRIPAKHLQTARNRKKRIDGI